MVTVDSASLQFVSNAPCNCSLVHIAYAHRHAHQMEWFAFFNHSFGTTKRALWSAEGSVNKHFLNVPRVNIRAKNVDDK